MRTTYPVYGTPSSERATDGEQASATSPKKATRPLLLRQKSLPRSSTKSSEDVEILPSRRKQHPVTPLPVTWDHNLDRYLRPSTELHTPALSSAPTSTRTVDRHSITPSLSPSGLTGLSACKSREGSRASSEMFWSEGSRHEDAAIRFPPKASRAGCNSGSAPASRVTSPITSPHVCRLPSPAILQTFSPVPEVAPPDVPKQNQVHTGRRPRAPSTWHHRIAKSAFSRRSSLSGPRPHLPDADPAEAGRQASDSGSNPSLFRRNFSFRPRMSFSSSHRSRTQSVSPGVVSKVLPSDMELQSSSKPRLSGLRNFSAPTLPGTAAKEEPREHELPPPVPLLPHSLRQYHPHQGIRLDVASVLPLEDLESAPSSPNDSIDEMCAPGRMPELLGLERGSGDPLLAPIKASKERLGICWISKTSDACERNAIPFECDSEQAAASKFDRATAWEKAANMDIPEATVNDPLAPTTSWRKPYSKASLSLRRVDRALHAFASRQGLHSSKDVSHPQAGPAKVRASFSAGSPAVRMTPQLAAPSRASDSGPRTTAMSDLTPQQKVEQRTSLVLNGGRKRVIPACPGPAPNRPLPPIPEPKSTLTQY